MSGLGTLHEDLDLELLLEAIYRKYHYDFRQYAMTSMRRRIEQAVGRFHTRTVADLRARVMEDPMLFPQLLQCLTIGVSDMFRDPSYFRAFREQVVPILQTYPSLKIWIAGCATGEEAHSLAILLKEEGLLQRTMIYATDINGESLRKAEAGVYSLDRISKFSVDYQKAGGRGSLADYYTAAYGAAVFDRSLRRHIVFSDHSLATYSVFTEVHMVSCRNVLIYFNQPLRERAIKLFSESLVRKGFLGLGAKESLRVLYGGQTFVEFVRQERIYQKC